ncbi:hypothetical protein LSH36_401g01008, partial [Paralvinella palmiformis]
MSESTSSIQAAGMFDGLTAWFSDSVQQHYIDAWANQDGIVSNLDDAMYIFSEDPAAPDTQSIYSSRDYLLDSISVFHPRYIQECLQAGDCKQAKIGQFFLPPAEIQKG